jgi:hypothetical protein
LIKEFEGKLFSELRDSLLEKDSSFEVDFPLPYPDRVAYYFQHTEDLSPSISQVDFLVGIVGMQIEFVCLSGERLYT